MAEPPPLPLKKPPGYRDPSAHVYPPPNRPPLRRQRKKHQTFCGICCCCCCIFLIILLILLLIAFTVFYLWFKSQTPDMSSTFLTESGGDETDLGSGSVAGFLQAKKNVTSLKFVTNVKHVVIGDSTGAKLKAKWKSKELGVNVVVKTGVGFGSGGWRIRPVGVRVVCEM